MAGKGIIFELKPGCPYEVKDGKLIINEMVAYSIWGWLMYKNEEEFEESIRTFGKSRKCGWCNIYDKFELNIDDIQYCHSSGWSVWFLLDGTV